ncbi:hypothetical protein DRJ00_02725 [Candidatus Aerophobetes bacterium]|uniref:Efflux RND transporter periplasmic adaptor subunit n=1 Tax=Aerophobetes bacterium TaxID=2030807 RepID=A0A497E4T5_UNCAE|nr:MAG: hypothetical protein DRJ00_02725 [Candidatus Aerophobetes bacterium]
MKKIFIWALVITSAGLCLYYGARTFLFKQKKSPSFPSPENIITVKRGNIVRTVSAFGQVVPNREASLHFLSSGVIEKIYVEEGDKVKKGQILASLNNSKQRAELLAAKNAYEKAKVDSPKSEVEEKRLNYEAAYESYQATFIKAPFTGEITEVLAQEGDRVSSSTPVISMINRDKMFVEVNVDEVDIREVAIGQRATVRFDAYPDLELSARVSDISRVATVQGGVTVVKVTLELLKFDERIKPGFSAEVEITVAKAHDVLKVPVEAIVEKDGRYFVTQVTEDGLKPVSVKVGISDEEHVEILSGLREGDKILANNYKLFERLKKSEERGERRLPGTMPFAPPRSSRRR